MEWYQFLDVLWPSINWRSLVFTHLICISKPLERPVQDHWVTLGHLCDGGFSAGDRQDLDCLGFLARTFGKKDLARLPHPIEHIPRL